MWSKIKRRLIKPPLPKLEDGEVNLHLGCGHINHPKFINIDLLVAPHIHYVRPIDDLSVFKNKSVNLVYACHCLEHFSHVKTPRVLAEWFRVLKNDGILRLSVPDFDLLLDIYKVAGNNINVVLPPLFGGQEYKLNFHMTAFNHSSLEELLKEAGFRNIQKWEPKSSELTSIDDFSDYVFEIRGKKYPVSLNLEATK